MKVIQAILVGIVIGILIAPDKGSATREKLAGKLLDLKDNTQDYLSDAADNIQDKAGDIADDVKSKARQVADKVKSKSGDVENNTEHA